MNSNLRLVYDARHPEPEKTDPTAGVDFDALFTPDADFDEKLKQEATAPVVPSSSNEVSSFPELNLDFDLEVDQILSQSAPPPPTGDTLSRYSGADFSGFTLLSEESSPSQIETPEKGPEVISILEEYSSLYALRFQEILAGTSNATPEESFERYAKILLYILEQFHIHGEKKTHMKFMTYLKKVLTPLLSQEELEQYQQTIQQKGYMLPRPELQEEVETLFDVYYACFQESKREIKQKQMLQEQEERKLLSQNITQLEKEVFLDFEKKFPQNAGLVVSNGSGSNIQSSMLSSSLSKEIEKSRWQFAQRRAQRQNTLATESDEK